MDIFRVKFNDSRVMLGLRKTWPPTATKLTRDYGVEPDKAAYKAVEQVFRVCGWF